MIGFGYNIASLKELWFVPEIVGFQTVGMLTVVQCGFFPEFFIQIAIAIFNTVKGQANCMYDMVWRTRY